MVGHPGYAPGISPSQAARIAIFLVPDENGGLCGHCSRDLPLDRRLLFVAELTGREMVGCVGNAPTWPALGHPLYRRLAIFTRLTTRWTAGALLPALPGANRLIS